MLSGKSITGDCAGIDRRSYIYSEGVKVPLKPLNLWWKLAEFKIAVSLELFDRFWCSNFWVKALDVYFHPTNTAGPSDPYNRRNTAAASYGQHWKTSTWSAKITPAVLCKVSSVFIFPQASVLTSASHGLAMAMIFCKAMTFCMLHLVSLPPCVNLFPLTRLGKKGLCNHTVESFCLLVEMKDSSFA